MQYGLVYKINDLIFLSLYDEHGNIGDGEAIDDPKGIYDSFTLNDVSFVEVHSYQQDVQYLKDLRKITVRDDEDDSKTFLNLLQEGGGPEFAKQVYEDIMR